MPDIFPKATSVLPKDGGPYIHSSWGQFYWILGKDPKKEVSFGFALYHVQWIGSVANRILVTVRKEKKAQGRKREIEGFHYRI